VAKFPARNIIGTSCTYCTCTYYCYFHREKFSQK
jgi:hypothetical protein